MSGVCPAPKQVAKTDFSSPGTFSVSTPNPRFNGCEPAQTVNINDPSDPVVIEKCCETPGPPGPQGPPGQDAECAQGFNYRGQWEAGNAYETYDPSIDNCETDIVLSSDDKLYICIADHISSDGTGSPPTGGDEPGIGSDWELYWELYLPGTGSTVIRDIVDGECFEEGELGSFDGCIYEALEDVCLTEGPPSTFPEPDLLGGFYWNTVSCQEDQGFLQDIFGDGGWLNWIKDIATWGLEQLLGNFLTDSIVGGPDLNDEFNTDPTDPANIVDSTYKYDETVADVAGPNLQQVCARICELCNIDSSQYNVSLLPTTEVNMTLGNITTGRAVFDLLTLVYQFNIIDIGSVKFVPVAPRASVKTLKQYEDLGFTVQEQETPAPLNVKSLQQFDLPKEVNLTYFSKANAHEKFVQTVRFETIEDGTITNLEVPISLDEAEAYAIAENVLVNANIEAKTYSFSTSYDNLEIEPEDYIDLESDLFTGSLRVLRVDESVEGGVLNFVAVNAPNNQLTWAASDTAPAAPPTYDQTPKVISKSSGIVFEIPPFTDLPSGNLRLTLAPHGYGAESWPGCDIYYSLDGTNYTLLSQVGNEATWGRVATATSSVSNWYILDETTTIDVELKTGTITAPGYCIVGQEVINFLNVTDLGGGTYRLSNLYRGRKGTEDFISTHNNNEVFVLLNDNTIPFNVDQTQYQQTYYFKFVTIGSTIDTATPVQYAVNGKSRRPWRVANLTKTQRNDGGWLVEWSARNQLNGELRNGPGGGMPDNFGGYVINILDPLDNIVRTFYPQTNKVLYTEQQQIDDFGSAQSSITVDIAQIDRIVGAGYNIKE